MGGGGTEDAIFLVVVETPDVLDGDGLRFQLERWKLFGEKEIVQAAEKGLVQRLKGVGSEQEMEFRLSFSGCRIHFYR